MMKNTDSSYNECYLLFTQPSLPLSVCCCSVWETVRTRTSCTVTAIWANMVLQHWSNKVHHKHHTNIFYQFPDHLIKTDFCAVAEGLNGTYKSQKGCQPDGQMSWVILHIDLPGFPHDKTLQVNYIFQDGVQTVSLKPHRASI